eukprot:6442249-Ditylum_brightwellii.AAC.1
MYIGGASKADGLNILGWYFNIMLNPNGATTKLTQDKFCNIYHIVSSAIGLLKDHCERENKMNCYNNIIEVM